MKKNSSISSIKNVIFILVAFLIFGTIVFQGCINPGPGQPKTFHYSFEEGMQGWNANGIDLDNPPINWSVERSDELSYDGNYSIQLLIDNLNDKGKIWMQKEFNVSIFSNYTVSVTYMFATADFGDFNLFRIITGVTYDPPSSVDDLTFQGDTGHHTDEQDNFIWLNKTYNFTVFTNNEGTIYVSIGVWGTWETLRVYFVDDVRVTLTPS